MRFYPPLRGASGPQLDRQNKHVSRNVSSPNSYPPLRQRLIPLLIRSIGLGMGALGLYNGALAAAPAWNCQAGPNGEWQCSRDGKPELRPVPSTSSMTTPLARPRAAEVTQTPAAEPTPVTPAEVETQTRPAAVKSGPVDGHPSATPAIPTSAAAAMTATTEQEKYGVDNASLPATGTGAATPPAGTARPPQGESAVQPAATSRPLAEPDVKPSMAPTAENTRKPDQPTSSGAPVESASPLPAASTASNRARIDEGIPWSNCGPTAISLNNVVEEPQPVEISADSAEASDLDLQALFSGNVDISQGAQRIQAQQARYDHASGELTATGDALLLRPDLRIAANEVHYNLRTGRGDALQAEYRLPGILARGTAEKAALIDSANSDFSHIDYTTCPPGNSAWKLGANRLQIDTAEGLGTATDARLYFADVPVMYLPILTFPIDERRRSGLLLPSVGYGDRHGFDLRVPYYFNLAPNYDATLAPRLMSKRGIMLDGEFRFLTQRHQGQIRASFIPHDQLAPSGNERRGSLSLQTHSQHTDRLSSAVDINYVSDDDFLEDFGPDIETYSASQLERNAEIHYRERIWSASAKVQQFQTIDPLLNAANRPYDVLPRLRFDAADGLDLAFPARYSFGAEFANFSKDSGVVEGRRLDLYPRLAMPMREAWYHLTPAVGLRYTRYELDQQTAGLDTSPDRLAPILSLDSGLYFDRDMNWFGQTAVQSLEPRAYYLYVPKKDQADIPVFDTARYGLSFDNLFRENRFSSADRLGDANQVTLALTSTVSDLDSGRRLLSARLGQTLYLADREVQLPGVATETQQTSPLIADLSAALSEQWQTRGELVWDPDSNDIEQALARVSYRADRDHIFSTSYRLRDVTSSETDLAVIWPIGRQTRAIARWNYSLSEQRNLDALAGLEYGTCCWKLRTLIRQQVTGTNSDQNLSLLLQLELRGLAKLGDNIDSVLKDGIYGYRREND